MDRGKAKYYYKAIEQLEKVRYAYIASDRKQEWSKYRTKLVTIHGRKRKLMGLMQSVVQVDINSPNPVPNHDLGVWFEQVSDI